MSQRTADFLCKTINFLLAIIFQEVFYFCHIILIFLHDKCVKVYPKYAYNFKSVYEFWTGVINFGRFERTQELMVT